jgi:hypothetical protein
MYPDTYLDGTCLSWHARKSNLGPILIGTNLLFGQRSTRETAKGHGTQDLALGSSRLKRTKGQVRKVLKNLRQDSATLALHGVIKGQWERIRGWMGSHEPLQVVREKRERMVMMMSQPLLLFAEAWKVQRWSRFPSGGCVHGSGMMTWRIHSRGKTMMMTGLMLIT